MLMFHGELAQVFPDLPLRWNLQCSSNIPRSKWSAILHGSALSSAFIPEVQHLSPVIPCICIYLYIYRYCICLFHDSFIFKTVISYIHHIFLTYPPMYIVHIYVYICIYMYIYMYIYISIHPSIYPSIHPVHTCVHAYMHTCIHPSIFSVAPYIYNTSLIRVFIYIYIPLVSTNCFLCWSIVSREYHIHLPLYNIWNLELVSKLVYVKQTFNIPGRTNRAYIKQNSKYCNPWISSWSLNMWQSYYWW